MAEIYDFSIGKKQEGPADPPERTSRWVTFMKHLTDMEAVLKEYSSVNAPHLIPEDVGQMNGDELEAAILNSKEPDWRREPERFRAIQRMMDGRGAKQVNIEL